MSWEQNFLNNFLKRDSLVKGALNHRYNLKLVNKFLGVRYQRYIPFRQMNDVWKFLTKDRSRNKIYLEFSLVFHGLHL